MPLCMHDQYCILCNFTPKRTFENGENVTLDQNEGAQMLQIKSLTKMTTYKSAIITYIMTVNKLFLLHFHWSNLNCDFKF